MAKVNGRAPLPLPEFLTTSLRSMGYLEVEPLEGVKFFRHPAHRRLFLHVVASNVPGDTDTVLAKWYGREQSRRLTADTLVEILRRQIAAVSGSTADARGIR